MAAIVDRAGDGVPGGRRRRNAPSVWTARQSFSIKRFASGWCRYRARSRARARRFARSASGLTAIMQRNRATETPINMEPKMATNAAADIGSLLRTLYTCVGLRANDGMP